MRPEEALTTRPKRVALIGLGMSAGEYVTAVTASACGETFDEVWTVNAGLAIFRHDKAFVMDDLRVQAKAMPPYGYALATHDRPIITSQPYPEFPMSVRYPIEPVIEKIGDDFFANTVAYAMAYGILIGVKQLSLYGCDFWYPQQEAREEGGQNAAYLLGMARHFGMSFRLPQSTTLLSAHGAKLVNGRPTRTLYGYAVQPEFPPAPATKETSSEPDASQGPRVPARPEHDGSAPRQDDPLRAAQGVGG